MTKEEALELFDLAEEARNDEILQKYRELYSDYSLRLTNAPTPNLKKIYNQNIQKLEDAFKLLCPDIEVDESQFLPTDKPIVGGPPAPPDINLSMSKNTAYLEKVTKEKVRKKSSGLTNIFVIASFIFFAAGVSFLIMYLKRESKINSCLIRIESLKKDSLKTHSAFNPISKNKIFRIRNDYDVPTKITWIFAIYLDDNNKYKCFYDNMNVKIDVGSTKDMSNRMKNWDGKVIFYSFIFTNDKIVGEGHVSGIWSEDAGNEGIIIPPVTK